MAIAGTRTPWKQVNRLAREVATAARLEAQRLHEAGAAESNRRFDPKLTQAERDAAAQALDKIIQDAKANADDAREAFDSTYPPDPDVWEDWNTAWQAYLALLRLRDSPCAQPPCSCSPPCPPWARRTCVLRVTPPAPPESEEEKRKKKVKGDGTSTSKSRDMAAPPRKEVRPDGASDQENVLEPGDSDRSAESQGIASGGESDGAQARSPGETVSIAAPGVVKTPVRPDPPRPPETETVGGPPPPRSPWARLPMALRFAGSEVARSNLWGFDLAKMLGPLLFGQEQPAIVEAEEDPKKVLPVVPVGDDIDEMMLALLDELLAASSQAAQLAAGIEAIRLEMGTRPGGIGRSMLRGILLTFGATDTVEAMRKEDQEKEWDSIRSRLDRLRAWLDGAIGSPNVNELFDRALRALAETKDHALGRSERIAALQRANRWIALARVFTQMARVAALPLASAASRGATEPVLIADSDEIQGMMVSLWLSGPLFGDDRSWRSEWPQSPIRYPDPDIPFRGYDSVYMRFFRAKDRIEFVLEGGVEREFETAMTVLDRWMMIETGLAVAKIGRVGLEKFGTAIAELMFSGGGPPLAGDLVLTAGGELALREGGLAVLRKLGIEVAEKDLLGVGAGVGYYGGRKLGYLEVQMSRATGAELSASGRETQERLKSKAERYFSELAGQERKLASEKLKFAELLGGSRKYRFADYVIAALYAFEMKGGAVARITGQIRNYLAAAALRRLPDNATTLVFTFAESVDTASIRKLFAIEFELGGMKVSARQMAEEGTLIVLKESGMKVVPMLP